jgi:hypothetical protein
MTRCEPEPPQPMAQPRSDRRSRLPHAAERQRDAGSFACHAGGRGAGRAGGGRAAPQNHACADARARPGPGPRQDRDRLPVPHRHPPDPRGLAGQANSPFIPGHEGAGIVEQVGPGVSTPGAGRSPPPGGRRRRSPRSQGGLLRVGCVSTRISAEEPTGAEAQLLHRIRRKADARGSGRWVEWPSKGWPLVTIVCGA